MKHGIPSIGMEHLLHDKKNVQAVFTDHEQRRNLKQIEVHQSWSAAAVLGRLPLNAASRGLRRGGGSGSATVPPVGHPETRSRNPGKNRKNCLNHEAGKMGVFPVSRFSDFFTRVSCS